MCCAFQGPRKTLLQRFRAPLRSMQPATQIHMSNPKVLGEVIPTQLWLNLSPKVKLIRLFGKRRLRVQMGLSNVLRLPRTKENSASEVSSSIKKHAACNSDPHVKFQSVRRGHTYPTLVEFITKSQTHKTLWKTKVACSKGDVKCVAPSKENSLQRFRAPLRSTMQAATGLEIAQNCLYEK